MRIEHLAVDPDGHFRRFADWLADGQWTLDHAIKFKRCVEYPSSVRDPSRCCPIATWAASEIGCDVFVGKREMFEGEHYHTISVPPRFNLFREDFDATVSGSSPAHLVTKAVQIAKRLRKAKMGRYGT